MASIKKVKAGFFHKATTKVEETATNKTNTTTCHITKHNNYNTSSSRSSSRSHYYSSTTICNMKQRHNNNKSRKTKNSHSVHTSFSSNICCNNKVCCNKGCTNNNSCISGSSTCWPSFNLFYFSCKSPNSIITFITTTMAKCISNLQNLCYCWWNWSWWSLQRYKIKNKIVNNSYASSLSKDWEKRAALKTSSNNKRSIGGGGINIFTSLKLYFFLWLFLSLLAPCISLTMTEVRIPKHIMRYETATLGCKYDLDGESLYSVKWYKDGFEFYRYVPRDMPPGQVFPLPGVDVDLQNSTDNVVVLNRVTLQSTGRYRCEVSGEAPSFQTVSGHEDMIVVVTPLKGPQITGGQPRYSIGEKVSVNCTSAPSKPICHLSWLINGVHANRSYLRYYEPKIVGREGLEVATLGLEFRVRG